MLVWQGCVLAAGGARGLTLRELGEREGRWHFTCVDVASPAELVVGVVCSWGVALDAEEGTETAFLLTHSRLSSEPDRLHRLLSFDHGSREVSSFSKFIAQGEHPPASGAGFLILDGPTVLWSQGDLIRYVRGRSSEPVTLSLGCGGGSAVVERLWGFNWSHGTSSDDAGRVLLLVRSHVREGAGPGSREEAGPDSKEGAGPGGRGAMQWSCWQLGFTERGVAVKQLPPSSCIPPEKPLFLVGTSYRQVAVFVGGALLYCIPLPFALQSVVGLGTPFGLRFAVLGKTGDARAFRGPGGDLQPQECGAWRGVSRLLVGDFTGGGVDMLLVVNKTPHGNENLAEFTITDLDHTTLGSEALHSGINCPASQDESLVGALKALKARQQTGEAHLVQLERELHQKRRLLVRGLEALGEVGGALGEVGGAAGSRGDAVKDPDPSLVVFLPGKVETVSERCGGVVECCGGVATTQTWQRVVRGQWLVAALVKNNTESALHHVGLSLLPCGSTTPLDSSSHLVWWGRAGSPDHSTAPDAKRARLEDTPLPRPPHLAPSNLACLVVRSALPEVGGVSLEAALVCSWREEGGGGRGCGLARAAVVGTVELSVEDAARAALDCSDSCLSLWSGEQLLRAEQSALADRRQQDLACLLATHTHTLLEVQSSSLLLLPGILTRLLPLKRLPSAQAAGTGVTTETGLRHSDCVLVGREGILRSIYLHVSPAAKSARLAVLHLDSIQLSLLLCMLRACLPGDVTVSLAPKLRPPTALSSCLAAVAVEVGARARLPGTGERACSREDIAKLSEQTDASLTRLMYSLT